MQRVRTHHRAAHQVRLDGIAGLGVQDVIVGLAVVCLELTLVQAACHHRHIAALDRGDGRLLVVVGILHANVPIAAIGLGADETHVPTQVENAAHAAALRKERLERICDVALGGTSQIQHGLGVCQGDRGAVHRHAAVVDVLDGLFDIHVVGFDALYKIPKAAHSADGDVKKAL